MTMLDRMRRHKGWLKWSLALVVLTFVVFYIPDFLTARTGAAPNETLAQVEGAPITVQQFLRRYNAQVNALRAALPERVRVGTVDKFQGQEAPVCLVSMTASSIAEVPRGMGFLFSPERINVALSRARALVLVFAAPRLLDAPCATLDEIRLVDTLCALPVAAAPAAAGDAA